MIDGIYRPPVAEPLPVAPINRKRGRKLAVWGVVLLSGPFVGMIGMMVSMMGSFAILSETGSADPEELAGTISGYLMSVMIGLGLGLVGSILCSMALFGQGNRERWFQVVLLILAVPCLLIFPIGTVIALVPVFALVMRWREFRPAEPGADPNSSNSN